MKWPNLLVARLKVHSTSVLITFKSPLVAPFVMNSIFFCPITGSWKIQSGTYCCYNAFTRVDVRVEVTMPGSVNAYVLDAQGRRYGCDDRMWQEVLISSVLRALKKPSPFLFHIDALRSFYPFKR